MHWIIMIILMPKSWSFQWSKMVANVFRNIYFFVIHFCSFLVLRDITWYHQINPHWHLHQTDLSKLTVIVIVSVDSAQVSLGGVLWLVIWQEQSWYCEVYQECQTCSIHDSNNTTCHSQLHWCRVSWDTWGHWAGKITIVIRYPLYCSSKDWK